MISGKSVTSVSFKLKKESNSQFYVMTKQKQYPKETTTLTRDHRQNDR